MMLKFIIVLVIVSVTCKAQRSNISSIESSEELKNHQKFRFPRSSTCNCKCGKRNESPHLTSGANSGVNEFPWMAFVYPIECSAFLINDRYVLTAKHCLAAAKPNSLRALSVVFHSQNRCTEDKTTQRKVVQQVLEYGGPAEDIYSNDIALLRLQEPVTISPTLSPICLPKNDNDQYVGIKAIVAGWGGKVAGKSSCTLNHVEVPVMANTNCQKYSGNRPFFSSNLCAGYPNAVKKDACLGERGGPLFKERRDKSYEAIGIVSRGKGCGQSGYPGVYTRVSKFIDWIRENTQDACYCAE